MIKRRTSLWLMWNWVPTKCSRCGQLGQRILLLATRAPVQASATVLGNMPAGVHIFVSTPASVLKDGPVLDSVSVPNAEAATELFSDC